MDRNPIFNLRRFTRLPAFNDIIILVNVWTFSKPISSLIPPQFFLMKILFSLIYLFIYFPSYFHPLNIQARTPLSLTPPLWFQSNISTKRSAIPARKRILISKRKFSP